MRRFLIPLLLIGMSFPAMAEEFELGGAPFDLSAGERLLTNADAKVTLAPLAVDAANRTALAVRGELMASFKEAGLFFDGDAVELVFRLNDVSTFDALAMVEAPVTLDVETSSGADLVNVVLDAELKGQLLESLAGTSKLLATPELTKLLPAPLRQDAVFIGDAYGAFQGIIREATKPISVALLRQLESETVFLQDAANIADTSGAWPDPSLPVIETIAADNRGRLESLLEPLGPDAGGLKGNNGSLRVEVALLDFSSGAKVEKHGFRVKFRPVTGKQFDELPAFTSPATGPIPEASLCFVAVDPGTGAQVSDMFFGTLVVLADSTPARIELSFSTQPTGSSRCTQ